MTSYWYHKVQVRKLNLGGMLLVIARDNNNDGRQRDCGEITHQRAPNLEWVEDGPKLVPVPTLMQTLAMTSPIAGGQERCLR